MYAHTTWPPPGGTTVAPTVAPTGAPHRADAVHRAPRCSATAPGSLGRWGR
ncbi:hypothetical protein ACFQ71_36705 [Streptomyces sp. NPDC056534]|uniref:hypothetical protein n=1 Tax=Streptomyces sp. NPDC056534 TaxID=3345857 RepID=UPI0036AF9FBB